MKNRNIVLTARGLWIAVFLLLPLTVHAELLLTDNPCFIDQLIEEEHYLRGDVNKDGIIDWKDQGAAGYIIDGQLAPAYYNPDDRNPIDFNSDGTEDYWDYKYLYMWRSGLGPAPSFSNVLYCNESPCIVRLGNEIIELTAEISGGGSNYTSWVAKAYTTDPANIEEIAVYLLDIYYGEQVTAVFSSYERQNSPYGLPDIAHTEAASLMPTPYIAEGVRGEVDLLTALMGLSTLITAKGTSQLVPQNPVGINSPVNIPKFFLNKTCDECFSSQDFCYQRGGSEQNKKDCDKYAFNCLGIGDNTPQGFRCGQWASRREYVKQFVSLYDSSAFRYHNEDWTCGFESKGPDIDGLLDAGTLINDCSSCEGQDACDVDCVVLIGGTTVEYPCTKNIYHTEEEEVLPQADTQAPSAPANLQASLPASGAIALSWAASTDNVGVTGYKVYRNGVLAATTASTSYVNTGLAAKTTYSYHLKAYDAAGNESLNSAGVSATTLGVPDAINNLSAGAGDGKVTLTWSAPNNGGSAILRFKVEYGSVASGGFAAKITDDAVAGITVSGLGNGTAYQFRVYAENALGAAPVSNVATATPKPSAQTPWQTNQNGTLSNNIAWNYTMGYHFIPQQSGTITKLGGFFNGTKTVYLWNKTTGQLLAQATVTSANSWSYASITPVNVQAQETYTVAVYLGGSGGSRRTYIAAFPRTYGSITIIGSTYNTYNQRPTNTLTTIMYGQADIMFEPN